MRPKLVASDTPPTEVNCDAILVGAFSRDESFELDAAAADLDVALDGYLTQYLQEIAFKAGVGTNVAVPAMRKLSAKIVMIAGLGPREKAGAREVRRASGAAIRRLAERAVVATTLHQAVELGGASAAAEGILLGNYRFLTYKSSPKSSKTEEVVFLGADAPAIERGAAIAEAQLLSRDLANEPADSLYPETLARKAQEIADVGGLTCTVWTEDDITKKGFGGLAAVAKGSERPPRFIELRYAPGDAAGKVALVGKGVTFDSGGLSLKDARGMEKMKGDMGGAAAVLGAMSALPRIKPKVEVVAYIPTTENLPGGGALKPGDVIRHYSSRTTEVNNTDAEGRLILADALAYACEGKPDAIVDIATLTGSIMVALGTQSTGLFCNDDDLNREIEDAAHAAGERVWRMPLYDDYKQGLESEVADVKNSGPRWGGSIIAALFLKDHLKEGIPWAHLDIAGADWAERTHDEGPKGATGVGTRTLISWIEARGS